MELDATQKKPTGNIWKKIKAALLFLGRGTLFLLGSLGLTYGFFRFFEGHFMFSELSILEILSSVVFVWVIFNYIVTCRSCGIGWLATVYYPLRNFGWFLLAPFLLLIVLCLEGNQEMFNLLVAESSSWIQITGIIFTFVALWFAWPKQNKEPAAADAGSEWETV